MRKLDKLYDLEGVIEVLGGPLAVRRLTNVNASSLWNWQYRLGRFPSRFYKLMTDELADRGFTAPAHLWGQVAADPRQKTAA